MSSSALYLYYSLAVWANFSSWGLKLNIKLFSLADLSSRVMSKAFRVSFASRNILVLSRLHVEINTSRSYQNINK
jgi:hypothetical protein